MAKSKPVKVCTTVACHIVNLVDKGLIGGMVGKPIPGQMCVEAVVSFAMREERLNDKPKCVHPFVRNLKIELNDHDGWDDDADRAAGLRKLSIAQLGSVGHFRKATFTKLLRAEFKKVVRRPVQKPILVKNEAEAIKAAGVFSDHEEKLDQYRYAMRYISTVLDLVQFFEYSMLSSEALHKTCDMVVTVLKKMNVPGTKYLWITSNSKRAKKALKSAGIPERPDLNPNIDYND